MYYNIFIKRCEVRGMQHRIYPVDVICLCDAAGRIQPLRLRVFTQQQTFISISIDKILRQEDICHVGAEAKLFLCRGSCEDKPFQFELKYLIRTHNWFLVKNKY